MIRNFWFSIRISILFIFFFINFVHLFKMFINKVREKINLFFSKAFALGSIGFNFYSIEIKLVEVDHIKILSNLYSLQKALFYQCFILFPEQSNCMKIR